MAYMNQAKKKELTPAIKAVLKKYGYKGSISVYNHSSLVVNIKSGTYDFIGEANRRNAEISERRGTPYYPNDGYEQVNTYHPDMYGDAAPFIEELTDAMKGPGYFCDDDSQTDYFHRSHYTDINVGKWDKPYVLEV
jgi:hypothetical protein